MSKHTNVVAVSLATRGAPVMLSGTLTDNALHVINLSTLPASLSAIRTQLDTMTKSAKQSGAEVSWFIEDPTRLLQGFGYAVRLDDKTADQRPVLAAAMERYRALTAMGGLMYPANGGGQFQISDSIMNIKVGDGGRTVYEIDWPQLKDASRALLLMIYGAMCQGPTHASYLERMYSELGAPQKTTYATTSFMAVTRGYDQIQEAKTPESDGWTGGFLS